jgi:hypothetical protein
MQPNKTKIALVLGALLLGASGASHAATYNVTLDTIADVTFTQITPISLGTSVYITAGGSCTVVGNAPAGADVYADVNIVAGTLAAANGALSGDCVGEGVAGVFEVASNATGDSISVLMGEMAEANGFSFSPSSSCIPVYGAASSDDDCETIPVNFAHIAGVTGDGIDKGTTDKKLRFTVGGVMTIGATDLAPEAPLAGDFLINVVYQ